MKPFTFYITFAIIVFFETILNSWLNLNWIHYISKPLIVGSIILFFLINSKHLKANIKMLMVLALGFSLFGDVLLLFVKQSEYFFISGLLAFLMAHIFYCILFYKNKNPNRKPHVIIIFLLLYAMPLFWLVKDGISNLLIPIILYMVVLLLMVTMAFLRKGNVNTKSFNLVFIGALLFMISDSLLAINKFYTVIPYEAFYIMFTYALAQLCIVLGILKQKN